MIFHETPIAGLVIIELERHGDERGWFGRTFCVEEFAAAGLNPVVNQANASFTAEAGTVRGIHYQLPPHSEDKYVRCTGGALYDVGVDLRAGSPTFGQHVGVELTVENRLGLYIPKGCAHGFQTLAPDTSATYLMSEPYEPSSERGLRWDDPALGIEWPLPLTTISEKDRAWPDFGPHLALTL
jgi:dTDP-4-dehydrorhamnose 3,5-epimerase